MYSSVHKKTSYTKLFQSERERETVKHNHYRNSNHKDQRFTRIPLIKMVLRIEMTWYQHNALCGFFSSPRKIKVLLLSLFVMHELSIVEGAPKTTTYARKNYNIISKSTLFLTINNQSITGETYSSRNGILEVHSVGYKGRITIRGAEVGKYLAMDSTGNVFLVTKATKEAKFIDSRKSTPGYSLIHSQLYRSKYLCISKTGVVTGVDKTISENTLFVLWELD